VNNDVFKTFITPFVDDMIEQAGGFEVVRDNYKRLPDAISHFIAGGVFGLVRQASVPMLWRDKFIPKGAIILNQEEIRRVLDLIRLMFETESTTS